METRKLKTMLARFYFAIRSLDPWLLGAVVLLSIGGLLNLLGTSAAQGLFVKQLIFTIVGFALIILVAVLDYRWFRSSPILGLLVWGIGLVLLAFVVVWGEAVRGAQNWLFVGPLSIGPVEIVKFGALVTLAAFFARSHQELVFPRRIFISSLIVVIPIALTFLQPDLGSAIILGALWFGVVVVLRMPLRFVAAVLLLTALVGALGWQTALHDYQKERILSFMQPEADPSGAAYQSRQATIAVGAGGFLGRGFFEADLASNLAFLPESATDFAFAALVERAGFVGGIATLTAFGVLLWRIRRVALSTTNNFSRVYAIGLFVLFFTEASLNIGMNLGMLPVTGNPLPFVSYGGSHTLIAFISLGLLESIRLHQPHAFVYDRDPISAM